MKRKNNINIGFLLTAAFIAGSINLFAQDSTKKELIVNVSYHMSDNKMVYLLVTTSTKVERKFEPVQNKTVTLYLDSSNENNLIAKIKTDEAGNGKAFLPPALKSSWESSPSHKFIAIAEAGKDFDETKGESAMIKTKISIDTTSDEESRSVMVTIMALNGSEWVPAKDVEMKVGISRLGGILSAGEDPTYTTDSSGSVTVVFNKDSLPGDDKGNILLAVKVENNDDYGNLDIEKSVPWGVSVKPDNSFFNQRTLWSTRNRTPPWLLLMAYSIALGVWGTIIYLVFQFFKIRKIGTRSSP